MRIGPSLRAAIFGHGAAVATFGGRGNVRRLRPTCYLTSVSEEARPRKRADERLFERLDLRQAEPSASQSDSAYSVSRRWSRSRETDLVRARASQRTRIKVAITSDQFQAGPAGVEVPAENTDAGEAAPSYVHQSRAVARAIAPPGSAGRDHRQPPLRWRRPPKRRNPPQAAPARREIGRDYERPEAPHRRREGRLAPDDDERI